MYLVVEPLLDQCCLCIREVFEWIIRGPTVAIIARRVRIARKVFSGGTRTMKDQSSHFVHIAMKSASNRSSPTRQRSARSDAFARRERYTIPAPRRRRKKTARVPAIVRALKPRCRRTRSASSHSQSRRRARAARVGRVGGSTGHPFVILIVNDDRCSALHTDAHFSTARQG